MLAHRLHPVALLGLSVVLLSACGSSSSESSNSSASRSSGYGPPAQTTAASSGGEKVHVSADESGGLYFNPKGLRAHAGTVTLVMHNPSSSGIGHGIAVEGNGVDKDGPVVRAGATSTVTVKLKPGKYEFYCPVPAHKKAGMKGSLLVQ